MVNLPDRVDLQSASGDFKAVVMKAMTDAAGQAEVPIASNEIAVAMKDDMLIANAIVAQTEPKTTGPQRVMFAYLSMAGRACARLLPPGFCTIEQHTDSLTGAPHAKFIRADGTKAL